MKLERDKVITPFRRIKRFFDKLRGKSQTLRHCPPQACVNYARMSALDWLRPLWEAGRVAVNSTNIGSAGLNGFGTVNVTGCLQLSMMRRQIKHLQRSAELLTKDKNVCHRCSVVLNILDTGSNLFF